MTDRGASGAEPSKGIWTPLVAAWLVALAATLGALFIGEVMGQTPCILCRYQRIFMFPLAVLLGIAAFREDAAAWLYSGALALFGLAIAIYHSLLYFGFVTEGLQPCSKGVSCSGAAMTLWGFPLPILSTLSFAAIIVLLAIVRKRSAP